MISGDERLMEELRVALAPPPAVPSVEEILRFHEALDQAASSVARRPSGGPLLARVAAGVLAVMALSAAGYAAWAATRPDSTTVTTSGPAVDRVTSALERLQRALEQGEPATVVEDARRLQRGLARLPSGDHDAIRRESAAALERAEQMVGPIPAQVGGGDGGGAATGAAAPVGGAAGSLERLERALEQGDVATIVDNAQRLRAQLDAIPPGQERLLRRASLDALERAEQMVGTIPAPDGGSVTDGAAVEEPAPPGSGPEAPPAGAAEPGSSDGSTDGSTDGGTVEGVAPSDGTDTTLPTDAPLAPVDEGDEGAGTGEGADAARTGDAGVSAEPPPDTTEPPPDPEVPPAEASSSDTSAPEPVVVDPATEGLEAGDEPHGE